MRILQRFKQCSLFYEARNRLLSLLPINLQANIVYFPRFHKLIDWKHPRNLIEKIYWLERYSDTSLWTVCADKYAVREYIRQKGCGGLLNELYGHWTNANEIDFSKIPVNCILKTTNGCGQNIKIINGGRNEAEVKKLLNKWLKQKYGVADAQAHYARIKPQVIAEQLLTDERQPASESLTDYKVWCIHGNPIYILAVYNRCGKSGEDYSLSAFDLEWNDISSKALRHDSPHYSGRPIPRPVHFEQMLEYARVLSADFLEVRVDFYEVGGRLYFGELTFSTGYGSHTEQFYEQVGSLLDISKARPKKCSMSLDKGKRASTHSGSMKPL